MCPRSVFGDPNHHPPPNNNMVYALKHFKYNYLWIMYNVFLNQYWKKLCSMNNHDLGKIIN